MDTRRRASSASKDKEGCSRKKPFDLTKPGKGTETLDSIPENKWIVSVPTKIIIDQGRMIAIEMVESNEKREERANFKGIPNWCFCSSRERERESQICL